MSISSLGFALSVTRRFELPGACGVSELTLRLRHLVQGHRRRLLLPVAYQAYLPALAAACLVLQQHRQVFVGVDRRIVDSGDDVAARQNNAIARHDLARAAADARLGCP